MNSTSNHDLQALDRQTSRSICDAIGERLQKSLLPEAAPSERLQQLLDEFRRRESPGLP